MSKTWNSSCVICLCLLAAGIVARPVKAQSGCSLRINEVLYHPGPGSMGVGAAEWVELYVAADIAHDTTFFITDQEPGFIFQKTLVVPGGTTTGAYIVVHNDGNPADDGRVEVNGIYPSIHYYIGKVTASLRNENDEVVLYAGNDATGSPCDYVQYNGGNSGRPAGFSWSGCTDPTAPQGYSMALDFNGASSDSACDWTTAGDNSVNDPLIPTFAPTSPGWHNNTTPTVVSLTSFSARTVQRLPLLPLAGMAILLLSTAVVWRRRTALELTSTRRQPPGKS